MNSSFLGKNGFEMNEKEQAWKDHAIDSVKKGTFRFADVQEEADHTTEFFYSDAYFKEPASELNPHLRTMSLEMAMAFFPSAETKGQYERQTENGQKLLRPLGFHGFACNRDYLRAPTDDSLGIACMYKEIQDKEGKFLLIATGFRGASYGSEWASNLVIGKKGTAEGFEEGRRKSRRFLLRYLQRLLQRYEKKGEDSGKLRIKYWISGYSRVAATANLLGADIDLHEELFHTRREDVFVYTFEAPRAAEKALIRHPQYFSNIHNTVNPHDLVPRMAPAGWGFVRFGQDDTVIPRIRSQMYKDLIQDVQIRVRRLNRKIDYDANRFHAMFRFKSGFDRIDAHWQDMRKGFFEEWWHHVAMDDYLDRFFDFMSREIAPLDREPVAENYRRRSFVANYQNCFSQLAKFYLGISADERDKKRSVLLRLGDERLTFKWKVYLYSMLKIGTRGTRARAAHTFEEGLKRECMTDPNFMLSEQEADDLVRLMRPLVYYVTKCASRDVKDQEFAYLSTLIENLFTILTSHYPEVSLAWMQTLDSYYTDPVII